MKRLLKLGLVLALSSLTLASPAAVEAQDRPALSCATLPIIASGLLTQHVSGMKEDAILAKRIAGVYAERLDPTEALLTDKEYAALEKQLHALVQNVRDRKCADFATLKDEQIKWAQEMEDFVRKTVSDKKYKLDKKRSFILDPEKRDRPSTEREQKALRLALIDFQMANYIASGTKKKEAVEKLIHRYELATKRVKEQSNDDLYGVFLNAYASALDPHTTYFLPEELEDFQISMQLSLEGIGARLSSRDGYTTIEELVPGGAADKEGTLKPKDQIIAVTQGTKGEAVDVIDMDLRDVVKLIRGKKGTQVTLTVLRKGDELARKTITIVRDKIDLKDQAASLKWQEVKRGSKKLKVAVIDLPSFYLGQGADSGRDVAKLVIEARKEKADAIVLDLSRNGGGALQSAVDISGIFIETGAVVGVRGRSSSGPDILNDTDPIALWDGPLVVLTSKVSASASEILAGALRDYGRAVIVGDDHTFGKGTVQQLTPLPAGLGAVKVTTALFFLPGGKSTQSIGVPSDVVVPSLFSRMEIGEKHQDFALDPSTTKRFLSSKANASARWVPVDAKTLETLREASKKRLADDKEFKEFEKELAKTDPDDATIKISEILKDAKDAKKDEDDEKKDEKELSIQAKEAAQIAADLALAKAK